MKTFVALLDILGFKELVNNNEHEKVVSLFESLVVEQLNESLDNFTLQSGTSKPQKFYPINYILISDSICLWVDMEKNSDPTVVQFGWLCSTISNILARSMIVGLPLRGAITFGNLTFSGKKTNDQTPFINQILVGTALVKAYQEEQMQEWAGCTVTDGAMDEYYRNEKSDGLLSSCLIRYNVPYKKNEIKEQWVINWLMSYKSEPDESHIRNSFGMYHKLTIQDDTERKISNTISFLRFGVIPARIHWSKIEKIKESLRQKKLDAETKK